MGVYLWTIPDDYPSKLLGEYDSEHGPDRFLFKRGTSLEPLPHFAPVFDFNATRSELLSYEDLGNNALVPLVSRRIARILLEICPLDIQLVPAQINCRGEVIADYAVVIATHRVRGLNHKESRYRRMIGVDRILGFEKAVYESGCLGSHDVARDEEYLSNLLISSRLYNELRGLKGLGVYAPSEMMW